MDIEAILQAYHYPGAFGLLLLAGFGAPFPEDIVLVISGYIASTTGEPIQLAYSILVCFAGVMIGDATMYGIGRRFGDGILQSKYFQFVLSRRQQRKIKVLLARHGSRIVFIARFMPGLRAPIFALCGGMKVPFKVFVCWDGLAACLSIPLFCYAGYRWGQPVLERIEHMKGYAFWIILGLAATGLAVKLGYMLWDNKAAAKEKSRTN